MNDLKEPKRMNKKTTLSFLDIISILLIIGIGITVIWGIHNNKQISLNVHNDELQEIDVDSIQLENNNITFDFTKVLLGNHNETRKLIVSTQQSTISVQLTDNLLKAFDFKIFEKTQNIHYTGEGYFVVDLDNLSKNNINDDKANKILTLQIERPYLQSVEIDPAKILIDDVQEGWFARGDIKLTVSDYNIIEKELKKRLEEEFCTLENNQIADANALRMVKDVYEPIVKAIDSNYKLIIEFHDK